MLADISRWLSPRTIITRREQTGTSLLRSHQAYDSVRALRTSAAYERCMAGYGEAEYADRELSGTCGYRNQ